jgi:uncharacterized protein
MKYWLLVLLLALSFAAQGQMEKLMPEKPSPIKLVNDYTQTLTATETATLEEKLMAFRAATTNEIAVVVLPTSKEYAIEDVALGIFRKWGIGQKGKNNGAILLVLKDDHKLRIQTGYGLEGPLPDTKCSEIIRNSIKPAFKTGDFYKGLDNGTTEMIRAVAPGYAHSLDKITKPEIAEMPDTVDVSPGQDTSSTQTVAYKDNYRPSRVDIGQYVGQYIGYILFMILVGTIVLTAKFGKKSNSSSTYSSSSSDSFSDSSSSDSSSSSDFGGGDSGGGGSSDSW